MKRSEVILALAPHFTHGFDFSMPEQYQQWADKTALAAEPFVKLIADEELAHRDRLTMLQNAQEAAKIAQQAALDAQSSLSIKCAQYDELKAEFEALKQTKEGKK